MNQNNEIPLKIEEVEPFELPQESLIIKFFVNPIEFIFSIYTKVIATILLFLSNLLVFIWEGLTSKEAIELYVTIGKILFFFIIAVSVILEAMNKQDRRGRRRNRY